MTIFKCYDHVVMDTGWSAQVVAGVSTWFVILKSGPGSNEVLQVSPVDSIE